MTPPAVRKRNRISKKDVADYKFTEAQVQQVAEFVKNHACLCSKRDCQWCNPKFKESLWKELTALFPGCTYLQVKKFVDARRTDFGKIEKRESRSGAAVRERTIREENIMSTWSFLEGHIPHETTINSDNFTSTPLPRTSPVVPDDTRSSQSDHSNHSGLSAMSIERRRRLRMERRTTPPTQYSTSHHGSAMMFTALDKILERIDWRIQPAPPQPEISQGADGDIDTFCNYLARKLKRLPASKADDASQEMMDVYRKYRSPSYSSPPRVAPQQPQQPMMWQPQHTLQQVALPLQPQYMPPPLQQNQMHPPLQQNRMQQPLQQNQMQQHLQQNQMQQPLQPQQHPYSQQMTSAQQQNLAIQHHHQQWLNTLSFASPSPASQLSTPSKRTTPSCLHNGVADTPDRCSPRH